jgi:uncharacterized membrane-anchored protein YjiN (DUF445 family)
VAEPNSGALRSEQIKTLRRYKMVPLLLLGVMALGYVLGMRVPPSTMQGYLVAFCEAAMVGALADWFAVTALFRRPLGLPIPHTAIIQTRKNALGEALAGFVQRHFLTQETIAVRAARIDFSQSGAEWLRCERNAQRLAGQLLAALHGMLHLVDERPLRAFLRREVDVDAVAQIVSPLLARLLVGLHRSGHHQPLLTELVSAARQLLAENQELLLGQAGTDVPWWLPRSVDKRLFSVLLKRVDELLEGVVQDPEHPLRNEIDRGMLRLTEALESGDEEVINRLQQAMRGCLDDSALHDVLLALWQAARAHVLEGTGESAREQWQQRLAGYLLALAGRLQESPALRELLNRWIRAVVEAGVRDHGHEIGRLISDTVASWDAKETARLVELEVGKDLQFIRINGTLVGGLIGVLIHSISGWLAVSGGGH